MHFLPDVFVICDSCKGARYNRETLEVRWRGKTIADVLDMTIEDAAGFFDAHPTVHRMLNCLDEVGLGYVQLGQTAPTLSGGEAQRVKLARELGVRQQGTVLYILDEPTTGLHMADIDRLMQVLNRLADRGHTLVVIEHNIDVIKAADWIIDLGPEGGAGGGQVIATGTPKDLAQCGESHTGRVLAEVFSQAE
jgi:excinuclease ABC subunit A